MHRATQTLCLLTLVWYAHSAFIRSATRTTLAGNSTENPVFSIGSVDPYWMNTAIRDIAYYLRSHKFNEYDRRFLSEPPVIRGQYIAGFPSPPLRSLHWEVNKHCSMTFVDCVKYLNRRVKETGLAREDDLAVVIEQQGWNRTEHAEQIKSVTIDCQKMKKVDEVHATPFDGPLERFQWRTTASYFMCWFTMNGVESLAHFNDTCDNYANCEPANGDARANDSDPFACALFSFCPNPCCSLRFVKNAKVCSDSVTNPCSDASVPDKSCVLNRHQNTHFDDAILNHWNVSCSCANAGYVWNSRYGMCVDINECIELQCDEGQACLNLPGSYACVCNWGRARDSEAATCKATPAFEELQRKLKIGAPQREPRFARVVRGLRSAVGRVRPPVRPALALVVLLVAF